MYKKITIKKCGNCNAVLPEDSEFCQYCGSRSILLEEKQLNQVKACARCGKELPDDSEFCQFCGSKVLTKKSETVSMNENDVMTHSRTTARDQNRNWQSEIQDERSIKPRKLKIPSAVLYILMVILLVLSLSGLFFFNKYRIVSQIANQRIIDDFRSDSYFVKGSANTIYIYVSNKEKTKVTATVLSGSGIKMKWGEWVNDGDHYYAPFTIYCSRLSSGVILFKNHVNNKSFKIYVTGN